MNVALTLWTVWARRGPKVWEAKPFTGNESWANLSDPDVYGEEVVMVAAPTKEEAEKIAGDRPATPFPSVLVRKD